MTDTELLTAMDNLIQSPRGRPRSKEVREVLVEARHRLVDYSLLGGSPESVKNRIKRYQLRIRNLEHYLSKKQSADSEQQAIIRRLNMELDAMRKEKWNG